MMMKTLFLTLVVLVAWHLASAQTKVLITTIFIWACTSLLYTQEKPVITFLHDGKHSYLMDRYTYGIVIRSAASVGIAMQKEENYSEVKITSPSIETIKDVCRTVFPKERAFELSEILHGRSLNCSLYFNSLKQQYKYMAFYIGGVSKCPFTLEELDAIENKLKSLKYDFNVTTEYISYDFNVYHIPIRFNKLYNNCE